MRKILCFVLLALLAACANKATKPDGEGAQANKNTISGENVTSAPTINPLIDPTNILSKRSVYFEFDEYVVNDKYNSMVLSHARYLRDNSNAKIRLEGNTDERGSREYNIALGQRRADSVKKVMTLAGTQEHQIESVSYGEEKPRAVGHDEASWAENRRVDIRYEGE
ncbi:MAG: peptidoglycan-associated lipoprotein [Nitrosomonadaceae bacterium]|nr:peptidoglycan-associated lipoprotein [Nitrosomonadaceae bacterium]|tara:strand:- start:574 stop:1074 length:501 start_codon:yes stop_codon:yes gene_type:complete